jgi:hypothetical protein
LTEDWRERVSESSLGFRLLWIPYLDERRTPTNGLTRAWDEQHRIEVATVSFQRIDAATRRAQLFALLASEMGANPGNWVRARNPGPADAMPATEFTAGRFLAYKLSQAGRDALPDPLYDAVFESGEIPAALETELVRRYRAKLAAGHAQPDLGDLR